MTIHQIKSFFYMIGLIVFASACDSSKEKPSANIDKNSDDVIQDCYNNTSNTNAFGTQTSGTNSFGTQTSGTNTFGTNTGTSTFGSNTTNSQSTFGLTQVTYNANIQPIVSAKCMSCHSVGSAVDLSNSINLPSYQSSMVSVVMGLSSQPEHSSIVFNSTEQTTFQTWAQNGFPLDDGSSSFGTGTNTFGNSTGTFGSDCGNSVNNTTPSTTTIPSGINDNEDIMQKLINSDIKAQCDTANQLVDRDNGVCFTESQLDMSWCNAQGIKDKFQASANAGAAVETELNSRMSAGFVIDQCGMESSKPIVTLYQRDDGQQRLLTAVIRIGS